MANEVVKYNNSLNDISFRKFTSIELDLFFSICFLLKEKGVEEMDFSFDEIKKLIGYKFTGIDRFYKDLKSMYKKLLNLTISYERGKKGDREFTEFVLFNRYTINERERKIKIKINPDFYFILNELTSNFTRFELREFAKLRSSYAKQMFKLLSQYNSTGVYIITVEEFKRVLDIPVTYKMCDIDKKVIRPILIECSLYFKNLNLTKIKKRKTISRFKFIFKTKKEKTLGYLNGKQVVADNRNFDDVIRESEIREEFEGLDINEQVKLIRKQLLKSNSI